MFDLRPLFFISFWLDRDPGPLSLTSSRLLFVVWGGLFLLGVLIRSFVFRRKITDRFVKTFFRRLGTMSLCLGLFGLVIYLFYIEEIPLFSARLWVLLWAAVFLVWLGFIIRYAVRIIPSERERLAERARREKYLPGPRRHG